MTDEGHTLASDDVAVTVLPRFGARLHALRAFGVDLLRTPADPGEHAREPFFWGAYHLVPWSNRLAPGPVPVGGRTVALPSNFPDGSAIHGQVYAAPWTVEDDGVYTVTGGGDGWPWPYAVRLDVGVTEASVRLDYELANTSDDPMPAGIGVHPWFRPPATVRVPAERVFPDNTDTAAEPAAVSGPLDLRAGAPLSPGIDATWCDLVSPAFELAWPDEGLVGTIAIESGAGSDGAVVTAANPGHLGAVAVEPATHAPAGLRRLGQGEPYGLRTVPPGESLRLGVTMTFRRTAPS